MKFILSASKLMKAREVKKLCSEMRADPVLLLSLEMEYRKKIYDLQKEKAAS